MNIYQYMLSYRRIRQSELVNIYVIVSAQYTKIIELSVGDG